MIRPNQETLIDPPPVVCNQCNKKPSVKNAIVVATRSGIEQRGAFWQYGRYDRSRRKVKLYLKSGFSLVRWEARCECCSSTSSVG
jgi:hypothetical protein